MSNPEKIIELKIGPKLVQFRYTHGDNIGALRAIDQACPEAKRNNTRRVFAFNPQTGHVEFFRTESERNAEAGGSTW